MEQVTLQHYSKCQIIQFSIGGPRGTNSFAITTPNLFSFMPVNIQALERAVILKSENLLQWETEYISVGLIKQVTKFD